MRFPAPQPWTNHDRALRGTKTLDQLCELYENEGDPVTSAVDALADWQHAHGGALDLADIARRAQSHYQTERSEGATSDAS